MTLFLYAVKYAVKILSFGGEKMSRRGENIYKRKDGRWEGRYPKGRKLNGQLYYGYVYGKTYREVKKW